MRGLTGALAIAVAVFFTNPNATAQSVPVVDDLTESGQGLLLSDTLEYDSQNKITRALGNVEIFYKGRRLFADKVSYWQLENRVKAEGNVSVIDPDGTVVYTDSAVLSGDLAAGVIENLSARYGEFAKLAARRGVREGDNVTRLEGASYSPCKVCRENPDPLWQIYADEVEHDQTEQTITYKNPRFEVLGQPVFYLPYFQHPDPDVKRKTGLLQPSFFGSSELGYGIELPYFISFAPNRDLTISPLILTRELPLLNLEYRARTETGTYRFQGRGTIADRSDGQSVTNSNAFRGALFGEGQFDLGQGRSWGFDVERTTDDIFLRRYKITNDDRLTSKLYAERYWDQNFWSVSGLAFQDLRADNDGGITPLVMPFLEYNRLFDDPWFDGRFEMDASALAITRPEGGDTQRLSGNLNWERPFFFGDGQLLTLFGSVRADAYNVDPGTDADDPTTGKDHGFTSRFTPLAGAQWNWLFLRRSEFADQVIEPIIQLVVAPNGNNPGGIPNEDSASFEFDETNLFSLNKFPGRDRQESGPRMNVGLRYSLFRSNVFGVSAVLGQSFRLQEDDTFASGTGLSERSSDYVGRLDVNYGEFLDFTHRFRLDTDTLEFERAEVGIAAGPDWWRTNLDYVSIPANANPAVPEDREEVSIGTNLVINDNWSLEGNWQRDLADDDTIEARGGLSYRNECIIVDFGVKRRFTRDRELDPSTSIDLRVRLLQLGS